MKSILTKVLKNIFKLSLLNMVLLKINKIRVDKIIVYKNSKIQLKKSSRMIVENGFLEINKKWAKNDPFPFLLVLEENARVIVKGRFAIYTGSKIYVNSSATLILGSGYINHNLNLSCFEKISIGNNVAISENVCIRDSDNHNIKDSTHIKTKPVYIGDHVWIGMNVTILKGVNIGDGSIIAAGAIVNQDIPAKCLAGGVPAKVLRNDIEWN